MRVCHLWYVLWLFVLFFFFFSSRRRHTRSLRDWSSDVCSSDLIKRTRVEQESVGRRLQRRDLAAGVPRIASREVRSEEHTSELQSRRDLVCRLLLEKKKKKKIQLDAKNYEDRCTVVE